MKRLLVGLALGELAFLLSRVFFACFNPEVAPISGPWFQWFLGGLLFDGVAFGYLLAPWLLALPWVKSSRRFDFIFYFVPLAVGLLLNGIDTGFFQFSGKRLTFDFFLTTDLENQGVGQIWVYVRDFWKVTLSWLLCLMPPLYFVRAARYRGLASDSVTGEKSGRVRSLFQFGISALLLLVLVRGTFLLHGRPVPIAAAAQFADATSVPLVLNSVFTILRTSQKRPLSDYGFFLEEELAEIYTPIQTIQPFDIPAGSVRPKNLVVLILESFSAEYSAFLTTREDAGFTPFLDSLMQKSAWWPLALANGQRSIHAPPAILSSIPGWMADPYSLSVYSTNSIESVVRQLGADQDGRSVFFHGATLRSMSFDTFVATAGISRHYGRENFPVAIAEGDQNTWGVQDRPLLRTVAAELGQLSSPFVSVVFTLSSHHPYQIPDHEQPERFPSGEHPIHRAVAYSDDSLREFFERASAQPWYSDTLFVLTADHVGPRSSQNRGPRWWDRLKDASRVSPGFWSGSYPEDFERYRVPLVMFSPSGAVPAGLQITVAQQLDIYPTVMSLMGFSGEVFSFGKNLFDPSQNQSFFYVENQGTGWFEGFYRDASGQVRSVRLAAEEELARGGSSPFGGDSIGGAPSPRDVLKAQLQQYSRALRSNRMQLPHR